MAEKLDAGSHFPATQLQLLDGVILSRGNSLTLLVPNI